MAEVVSKIKYSGGRGRGVLGAFKTKELGNKAASEIKVEKKVEEKQDEPWLRKKLLVANSYTANPDSPGGFTELTIKKGDILEFISEHKDNEHWWEARNGDGMIGYIPSSYVILKEDQVLPWLEQSELESREQERQERLKRQLQQKDLNQGVGFGPPPKPSQKPYVYVSAYNRQPEKPTPDSSATTQKLFYCEVCEKSFNGPKPYKAHMASRGHKEEVENQEYEKKHGY
ncbi:PREDICTED: uncharacterized protein LOC100635430 [Amphimedon queenslandica]|uniref:SH3 domain-containing protein n=1 Tax=Amphimedon queenslandica TaxID=400682 RepID=A0A1X7VC64_AMPQE|nr:PREDICTED: uncharacterized protein LOC100635430 [Amphimedon queenslandica]|eukprot:XP_003384928.1 PREDICTED: uncharacterized protein LOC100635430 [Amphimedon queenslandica]